ncbi:MAG TPA: hypothetical protein VFG69_06220 [Nannocystaceae bacterium]|nr:hypothetical protein [Nannocystaceae bacterium]
MGLGLALACGDSGGDGDDDSTSTNVTVTAAETSGSPTGDLTTESGAPQSSTSIAPESSSDGSGGDSSSSTGGGDTVTLQNDGFTPDMGVFWQTWPMPDDCWASTYEIDAGLYPFDIVGLFVAIGGSTDVVTMEVGIWSVDGDGLPDQAIDSAMIEVEGEAQNDIDVEMLLDVPAIESGSFAVVMCHVDHMGAPSIGIDQDGTVDAAHNFIRDDGGDWVPSPDFFGTDGDFILRAIVRPG